MAADFARRPGDERLHPSGGEPGERAHPAGETLAEKIRRYRQAGEAPPADASGSAPPANEGRRP